MTVGIIDYGVGNIGSLKNMFYRLEIDVDVITSPTDVPGYGHIVLPGVGAFDVAAAELRRSGFDDAIRAHATDGRQLLGICLGMQLLLESSNEGELDGLGLVPGTSVKFDSATGLRVPHLGWAQVKPAQHHRVLAGLPQDHRFYFAHSYRAVCEDDANVLGTTDYGQEYTSMIVADSVTGAQFHPEKSHKFGMLLLKNWANI